MHSMNMFESNVSIKSSLRMAPFSQIVSMASAITAALSNPSTTDAIDPGTMFKLSYGLFILTARDGKKDNGCVINTVTQITASPQRITIAVNKANLTHDMIANTGEFTVSILTEQVPFSHLQRFGFHTGRDGDKFEGYDGYACAANGIRYVPEYANGVIAGKVTESFDYGTHTLFVAEVTQAFSLPGGPSVTYQYYFDHIKPKPQAAKKGFVCKICGYIYEGDPLPSDFICPVCKHPAADFEPIEIRDKT